MTRLPRQSARRGSVYVLVLGSSMLVTVIGLSAVLAVRVQQRAAKASSDIAAARLQAAAAVEMGTFWIEDDPDWRTNRPNGWWTIDQALGDGTFSLQVTDPGDGILSDGRADPVLMRAVGNAGDSRHVMEVTLEADVPETTPPLAVVGTAIHANSQLRIASAQTLTVTGAPASSNADARIDGTLVGDLEAATRSGVGTHLGAATVPAPAKDPPDATVIDSYVAIATTLPFGGILSGNVLTPTYNDYGGSTNADGVYHLDTLGNDLIIEGSRLNGTLVIDAPLNTVTIRSSVLLQNFRADYPVLIVRGDLQLDFTASATGLREADWGVNYNPAGASYLAAEDIDIADTYPSTIEGFVHCTGDLRVINRAAGMTGSVLVGGRADIDFEFTINHDAALLDTPPKGYTVDPLDLVQMRIVRGSWQQIVE